MQNLISEQVLLSGAKYIKQKEYWLNKLSGEIPGTRILIDTEVQGGPRFDMTIPGIVFPPDLCRRIIHLGNQTDLSIYIILLAALYTLIYRCTGNRDMVVISPVYALKAGPQLINNFLFVRQPIHDGLTFKGLLLKLKNTLLEAYDNQDYPFDKLIEHIFPRSGTQTNISDIVCAMQNIHNYREITGMGSVLEFVFTREGDNISGQIRFAPGTSKGDTFFMQRLPDHLVSLLEYVVKDVNTKVSHISFLSNQDKERLLFEFNGNHAEFPKDKPVYRFIEEWAGKEPNRVALAFAGKEVTYLSLNRRANQLARLLQASGIKTDETAAIMLDRSPLVVESILAVWKAGGAYIPIDPSSPRARITSVLKDSRAKVLLTLRQYAAPDLEKDTNVRIIEPREAQDSNTADVGGETGMHSLAYVIFTSGSTGKPKGAMVEHIGMMNHLHAKIHDLRLTNTSIAAQNATLTFDISVWQLFAALIPGGKTIIYPDEIILEPDRFITRLRDDRVTILEVVPSYLAILLETPALRQASPTLSPLPALEYLLVTGEEIKPQLVKKWFENCPHIKLVNAYGPTEASDDITHFHMDNVLAAQCPRIPIGKPIQNTAIYIVDENMNLCPPGVKGEICVSGTGVGRGYLNNPELSAGKFIMTMPAGSDLSNPSNLSYKSYKIYKTGDLGRWLPDGNIEFFGRKDHQVKIRGFRIELGEIENELLAVKEVKEVVLTAKDDKKGNKYLCAYLVMKTKRNFNTREIEKYLTEKLPGYMVPAYFVQLDKIPLTPAGKIDRKALPEPDPGNRFAMKYVSGKMLKKKIPGHIKPGEIPGDFLRTFLHNNDLEMILDKELNAINQYSKQQGINYYPLNHSQKMVYNVEKMYPGTACENEGYMVLYPGKIDKETLEKAINYAFSRNENLRTRIVEIEHDDFVGPAQYILEHRNIQLDSFDFTGKDGKNHLKEWIEENTDKSCDIIDSDLFYFAFISVDGEKQGYYMKFHHFISDGGSRSRLINEIDKTYRDLKAGKIIHHRLNPSHTQFILDEREYLKSSHEKTDREFWLKYLLPLPEKVVLSSKKADPGNVKGNIIKLDFSIDLSRKMHEYCRQNKTSLFKLFLSALSIYISRVTRLDEFVISIINHGRSAEIHKKMMGMFLNFLPLKISIDNNMDFQNFTGKIGRDVDNILKNHSRYPASALSTLLRKMTGKDTGYLWDITLVGSPVIEKGNFIVRHIPSHDEQTPLTIHINSSNTDIESIVEIRWVYKKEHFSPGDIGLMQQRLVNILTEILDNPGKKLADIRTLTSQEKKQLPRESDKIHNSDLKKIENCLLKYQDIKEAIVILRKEMLTADKHLYAFVTSGKALAEPEVREFLSGRLPAYLIPSYFVQLEKIPLTPEGDVDRELLTSLEIVFAENYSAPGSEVEEKLAEIWWEVLGIEKEKIGIDMNFFQLGGHSLRAVILASKIHKEFNIILPLAEVFKTPTIKGLAEFVAGAVRHTFTAIEPVEKKDYYSLSSAQKRLYFLQQMDPQSTAYNMPQVIPLAGDTDTEKIKGILGQLIRRHESLRTSFQIVDHRPVQRIHPDAAVEIEDVDSQALDGFLRPFSLSRAPLLRIGITKGTNQEYLLLVDVHHIITDGVSHPILAQEFNTLYEGGELRRLRLQYKDFSRWQNLQKQTGHFQAQETYWLNIFTGQIPELDLPLDTPRTTPRGVEGDTVAFEVAGPLVTALKTIAHEQSTTMFMVLLAMFYVFLAKLSLQEDIIIGTPVAGRRHNDLERIIGMFVNSIALRNYPGGEKNFTDFLLELKKNTLEAFENQDYQFEDLLEKLAIPRKNDRHPLFDVMFSFSQLEPRPVMEPQDKIPTKETRYPRFENTTSKFDLSMDIIAGEKLYCTFEYSSKLFKRTTVERYVDYFKKILDSVVADRNIKLKDIRISHGLLQLKPKNLAVEFGI